MSTPDFGEEYLHTKRSPATSPAPICTAIADSTPFEGGPEDGILMCDLLPGHDGMHYYRLYNIDWLADPGPERGGATSAWEHHHG